MPELIEWRDGVVRATRDLTHDIRTIEIAPSGEFAVPAPGSHINVSVLIRERPDVRSYSIVGPCTDGLYRIAVKLLKDTRGGSAYMWNLAPGARVQISGPANHFELGLGRPEYLLLAGGIGITPIFTHALALAEAKARFRVAYA
jgi:ferredoxin-NADP reductase